MMGVGVAAEPVPLGRRLVACAIGLVLVVPQGCVEDRGCSTCHPAHACFSDFSYPPRAFASPEDEVARVKSDRNCGESESANVFVCDGGALEVVVDEDGNVSSWSVGDETTWSSVFYEDAPDGGLRRTEDRRDPRATAHWVSVFDESGRETFRSEATTLVDADDLRLVLEYGYADSGTRPTEVLVEESRGDSTAIARFTIEPSNGGSYVERYDMDDDGTVDFERYVGRCCPERC